MPPLQIRIGINSGAAVVGNVGSMAGRDNTALGDTVNVASRLETINKIYGTGIIIGAETRRLTGDRIVQALGAFRVVLGGALVAAAGFAVAILVPSPLAGLAGFALVGAGAANVVPVMFSAAGRQHAMPTHLAVAAVTTMGYAGILLGPAALGFIARLASLSAALGLLVVLLVAVALVARLATRD